MSIIHYAFKMNKKPNLLEEYVNFVDSTKKEKTYFNKNENIIYGYFIFVFKFRFL